MNRKLTLPAECLLLFGLLSSCWPTWGAERWHQFWIASISGPLWSVFLFTGFSHLFNDYWALAFRKQLGCFGRIPLGTKTYHWFWGSIHEVIFYLLYFTYYYNIILTVVWLLTVDLWPPCKIQNLARIIIIITIIILTSIFFHDWSR